MGLGVRGALDMQSFQEPVQKGGGRGLTGHEQSWSQIPGAMGVALEMGMHGRVPLCVQRNRLQ